MDRNWTNEEIEKATKRTVKRLGMLAAKRGTTVEDLFLRLIKITRLK